MCKIKRLLLKVQTVYIKRQCSLCGRCNMLVLKFISVVNCTALKTNNLTIKQLNHKPYVKQ